MTGQQLKNSILQLAVQGKLVPQDPADEPASQLLARIREEKEQLIREKKIKREKNPSQIFRGDDGHFYERVGKNEPVCIDEELPFEIPESWEWCKLGEVCTIARGGSPRPIKDYLTTAEDGVNWIKIGDTDKNGKYIYSTAEKIKPSGVSKSRLVHSGDFLLTNSMSFGRPYILKTDGCIHDGWLVISQLNKTFDQDYLYWMLSSGYAYTQFCGKVSGAVVKNLNSAKVANSLFPLPPLAEQQRIIEKIEELLPFVERYEQAENKLEKLNTTFPDQLKKSILQEAIQGKLVPQDPADEPASALLERIRAEKDQLIKDGKIKREKNPSQIFRGDDGHFYERIGKNDPVCIDEELPFEIPEMWEWARLGAIALLENGDRSSKYPVESDYVSDGIPFFGAKDMGSISMNFDSVRFISEEKFNQLGNGKLHDGDLICLLRGNVGKTRLFRKNEKYSTGFICAQMLIIRCINLNLLPYLYSIFSSQYYFNEIEANVSGTAVRQLPAQKIAHILIPLPPLAEQQRIVAKLEQLLPLCEHLK